MISGLLNGFSDNIIPLLNPEDDVYIHTWASEPNLKWVNKVNRYKKYFNNLVIEIEKLKFDKKLHSYFYSTWKAVNLINNINQYTTVLKFKPNISSVVYKGDLAKYFNKAYIQSRPLLEGITRKECIYGSIYYQTLDERIFSGFPLSFTKAFHILYEDMYKKMIDLDNELIKKYGEYYEGSIFWTEWFNKNGIKLIQDTDLKMSNNIII